MLLIIDMNFWQYLDTYAKANPTLNKEYKRNIQKHKTRKGRERVEEFKRNNIRGATLAERQFCRLLEDLRIKFIFQTIIKTKKKYRIADFFLPEYNTIVEIDGAYHLTPEQQKADRDRTKSLLRKHNVRQVIRFDNDEVLDSDRDALIKTLLAKLCPPIELYITPVALIKQAANAEPRVALRVLRPQVERTRRDG